MALAWRLLKMERYAVLRAAFCTRYHRHNCDGGGGDDDDDEEEEDDDDDDDDDNEDHYSYHCHSSVAIYGFHFQFIYHLSYLPCLFLYLVILYVFMI